MSSYAIESRELESRQTTHNKLYFCFHLGSKPFFYNDELVA